MSSIQKTRMENTSTTTQTSVQPGRWVHFRWQCIYVVWWLCLTPHSCLWYLDRIVIMASLHNNMIIRFNNLILCVIAECVYMCITLHFEAYLVFVKHLPTWNIKKNYEWVGVTLSRFVIIRFDCSQSQPPWDCWENQIWCLYVTVACFLFSSGLYILVSERGTSCLHAQYVTRCAVICRPFFFLYMLAWLLTYYKLWKYTTTKNKKWIMWNYFAIGMWYPFIPEHFVLQYHKLSGGVS